ncbi:zinc finger protein 2 [Phlyctema vagabunda]|uniref:Zinc finger protein 2 n=1 Tax=Phlyctema vagabunda TaxID=108571 RepID=A0ABR4PCT9_9HELO
MSAVPCEWNQMGFEISEEGWFDTQAPLDGAEDRNVDFYPNETLPATQGFLEGDNTSNDASSSDTWLCDWPGCGRSFTHLHKLNRHKKYHSKPHQCDKPACMAKGVAFSLRKDLTRHQAQHDGRRFYCHYADCPYTLTGTKRGFTRKDNLRRHISKQHDQWRG